MFVFQGGERLVDDAFFQRNVKVLELAFDGQFHYGMFYAFVKLKEQEVKNLVRHRTHAFLLFELRW
jgi:vacuolar-type H+-ATPase subunit C/Vma6